MSLTRNSILSACLASLIAFATGCGGGDEGPARFHVKGNVSFEGQPVVAGDITFVPDVSQGNKGPATSVSITNGSYSSESGKGVIGGPHIVRVGGFDGNAKPDEELPLGEPLFPEYESTIDLPTAESQVEPFQYDVEVPQNAASSNGQRVDDV